MTIQPTFLPSDAIILNTVESYLRSLGTPRTLAPEVQLNLMKSARDYLYSEIAQRVPVVAPKILSADLETNDQAKALFLALSEHAMDPVFIDILIRYLNSINRNNTDQGALLVTGALLTRIMSKYAQDNTEVITKETAKDKDKKKKDADESAEVVDKVFKNSDKIAHLQEAVSYLLGECANKVSMKCGNLTYHQALSIAACIATNNEATLTEIINSDLPITADVFDIISNKNEIIKAALLLEKKDFTKLTQNQEKFIESLERWVFDKLEHNATTNQVYNFLLSIYGVKPDTNKYLINVRDCGTANSNLLQVVRLMTN